MKIESKVHAHTVTTLHVLECQLVNGAAVDQADGQTEVRLSLNDENDQKCELLFPPAELEELYLVIEQLRSIVRGRP